MTQKLKKQVSKITKRFLLDGEVKRDLIPSPFQKQTYYLTISGLIFYKFITKVLLYIRSFGVPVLHLGGGGYTLRNIPRCWTYETSIITGVEIPNKMLDNEY